MAGLDRLPRRFPIGTRYVVEGTPGADGELTITSRMVVLPDGTEVTLPVTPPVTPERLAVRMARRSARPTARRNERKGPNRRSLRS